MLLHRDCHWLLGMAFPIGPADKTTLRFTECTGNFGSKRIGAGGAKGSNDAVS